MSPQYKLTYFEERFLAEVPRQIFAYKGIQYTDIRFAEDDATWKPKKKDYPWGSLPLLEVDGKPLAQSLAIELYLAREYGLTGESAFEAAKCIELVEAMSDLKKAVLQNAFFETDATKKAEGLVVLKKETLPFYLQKFSDILKTNGKYLVGKKLTHADLNIANYFQIFDEHFPNLLKDFPLIKAHQETVFNTPGIKEWIAKRPKSEW